MASFVTKYLNPQRLDRWLHTLLYGQGLTARTVETILALIILDSIFGSRILIDGIITPSIDLLLRKLGVFTVNSPDIFLELTFPATSKAVTAGQLITLFQADSKRPQLIDRLVLRRKVYSFELLAEGPTNIRYLVGMAPGEVDYFKWKINRDMTGVATREVDAYMPLRSSITAQSVAELKLTGNFALPLQDPSKTKPYDPLLYLTHRMNLLHDGELAALQFIVSPIHSWSPGRVMRIKRQLERRISRIQPMTPGLFMASKWQNFATSGLRFIAKFVKEAFMLIYAAVRELLPGRTRQQIDNWAARPAPELPRREHEMAYRVRTKFEAELFETTVRMVVASKSEPAANKLLGELIKPLKSFSSPYSSLRARHTLPGSKNRRLNQFQKRTHSSDFLRHNPVFSTSELSALYHSLSTARDSSTGRQTKKPSAASPISKSKDSGNTSLASVQDQLASILGTRKPKSHPLPESGMSKKTDAVH